MTICCTPPEAQGAPDCPFSVLKKSACLLILYRFWTQMLRKAQHNINTTETDASKLCSLFWFFCIGISNAGRSEAVSFCP